MELPSHNLPVSSNCTANFHERGRTRIRLRKLFLTRPRQPYRLIHTPSESHTLEFTLRIVFCSIPRTRVRNNDTDVFQRNSDCLCDFCAHYKRCLRATLD